MNRSTPSLLFSALLAACVPVITITAAESGAAHSYVVKEADLARVTAADEERVAATIARDRARLEAIFSDELRYAHSSGAIDDKQSYIDSIIAGRSVYDSYDYEHRSFKAIAPGVVLMSGRAKIGGRNAAGEPLALDLNFLAVWREEGGAWRFIAWQSSRNPVPAPAAPPPPAPPSPAPGAGAAP